MIKAPFNFVPLYDRPYLVDWADAISQDIPFEDGISGTITLTIETKTPTFVGDEVKEDNTKVCEFCHITDKEGKEKYFIPGTSIKGMIRNVMEILSFGKMTQVQNQSFGIRDLSRGADGTFYRNKVTISNVHCGWLRYDKGKYLLKDCGKPWRISAEELDRKFNMGLMNFITTKRNFQSDENRTAQKKYEMFRSAGHKNDKLTDFFVHDNTTGIKERGRRFVRFDANGKYGTVVFTGQPGERNNKSGKFFEFVFPEGGDEVFVPENVFKAFESVHQNSPDYVGFKKKNKNDIKQITCYKDLLRTGKEIPVFFTYANNGNIDAMGISYMFKYPAFNSVYNGIPEALLKQDGHDLCECIFGYTSRTESLKGRVHFSHAMLKNENPEFSKIELALAKPHPSYYPLYLGNGQTWNVENVRIAGRKRYPVRDTSDIYPNAGTEGMNRIISPIAEGSTFEGVVRFHNLRPVELGALLDAIDYCQKEDCFHNIGQGKPLGYGKVKLSVRTEKENMNNIFVNARKAFRDEMTSKFSKWNESTQLEELFAMAEGIEKGKGAKFQYMKMSTQQIENEFLQGLVSYSQGEQLGLFTKILSGKVLRVKQLPNVSPNISRKDIELSLIKELDDKQSEREKILKQQAEERKKRAEELARQEQKLAEQKAKKEKELAEQKEAERLEQLKEEAKGIAYKALEAKENKKYEDAIDLYKKAASYGFETYEAQIKICEDELTKVKTITEGNFSTFLAGITITSLNAFADNLGKRNIQTPIVTEDVPLIIDKIKGYKGTLKANEAKKLLERRNWQRMDKALGKEITDTIFNSINK